VYSHQNERQNQCLKKSVPRKYSKVYIFGKDKISRNKLREDKILKMFDTLQFRSFYPPVSCLKPQRSEYEYRKR